jgi:hypothetical protein
LNKCQTRNSTPRRLTRRSRGQTSAGQTYSLHWRPARRCSPLTSGVRPQVSRSIQFCSGRPERVWLVRALGVAHHQSAVTNWRLGSVLETNNQGFSACGSTRIAAAISALPCPRVEPCRITPQAAVSPGGVKTLSRPQPNPAFKRTDTGGAHLRFHEAPRAPVPAA